MNASFSRLIGTLALAILLLLSSSVAYADVITVSVPLTTDSSGDAWNIFYGGTSGIPSTDAYLESYLNGWETRQQKFYGIYYYQWVLPTEGSWLAPVAGTAAGGLYAYPINLGTFHAGDVWTLFGSLATDNLLFGGFLVREDNSGADFNFLNQIPAGLKAFNATPYKTA